VKPGYFLTKILFHMIIAIPERKSKRRFLQKKSTFVNCAYNNETVSTR